MPAATRSLCIAALHTTRTLVICESLEAAPALRQDLISVLDCALVEVFPEPEVIEGRILPLAWQELIHRLRCFDRAAHRRAGPDRGAAVVHPGEVFARSLFTIRKGEAVPMEELLLRLVRLGYQRVPNTEVRGEFSVRGGIVDVFAPTATHPVRLEIFGDEIEEMRSFDPATQRSRAAVETLVLTPVREILLDDSLGASPT